MRARGGIQGGTLDAAILHRLQQYRYASPLRQQSTDGMFASGGAVSAPVVQDRLSRGRILGNAANHAANSLRFWRAPTRAESSMPNCGSVHVSPFANSR